MTGRAGEFEMIGRAGFADHHAVKPVVVVEAIEQVEAEAVDIEWEQPVKVIAGRATRSLGNECGFIPHAKG